MARRNSPSNWNRPVAGTKLDAEVIVAGAGPAGSATALLLAQAGHEVLLLDRASFPRHKACSEYVNAGGIEALRELDLFEDVVRSGAHQMNAMTVVAPNGHRFLADFQRAEPGRFSLGLSRYRLDALLLDRARSAGTTFLPRSRVKGAATNREQVCVDVSTGTGSERLRARLLIGADGHHSIVSQCLGLDNHLSWPRRTGLVAHYRGVSGLSDHGELHVVRSGYAGLAPLEDGLCNVAFVTDSDRLAARRESLQDYFLTSLRSIPGIRERIESAERVGGIRGIGPMARNVKRTAGDGYLLVGDAAGFLDPFTGDGIYEALQGALLAAPVAHRALQMRDTSGSALASYSRARRDVFARKGQVCWIVQLFVHHHALMDYVVPRLTRREELGTTLTGVLGNFIPASRALSPLYLARLLRP
jgi:menaquinone-9 beta-reductase